MTETSIFINVNSNFAEISCFKGSIKKSINQNMVARIGKHSPLLYLQTDKKGWITKLEDIIRRKACACVCQALGANKIVITLIFIILTFRKTEIHGDELLQFPHNSHGLPSSCLHLPFLSALLYKGEFVLHLTRLLVPFPSIYQLTCPSSFLVHQFEYFIYFYSLSHQFRFCPKC